MINKDKIEIHYEITSKCALNCIHCSSEATMDTYDKFDFGNYEKLLISLTSKYDIVSVFTGGEPLLYDESVLSKAFQGIKQINRNIDIGLFSSGCTLKDDTLSSITEDYASSLKNSGLDFVYISIYSHLADIHDEITKTPRAFNATINSIKNLIRAGVTVNAHLVIMAKNLNTIHETTNFLFSIGVKEVRLLRLVKHGRADCNWIDIGLTRTQQKVVAEDLLNSYKQGLVSVSGFNEIQNCLKFKKQTHCYAGVNKLYIDNKGFIYGCASEKKIPSCSIGKIEESEKLHFNDSKGKSICSQDANSLINILS